MIYSGKSCGFHYPLSTYKDLLYRHSDENTLLIFDLRKGADQGDIDFKIKDVIIDEGKSHTCVLQLL